MGVGPGTRSEAGEFLVKSNSYPVATHSAIVERLDMKEAIRIRAEEIYIRNGRIPGRDLDNWTQAETEILRETGSLARRTAIVVAVDGVQYVGEYGLESCGGYKPGEFSAGEDIFVRFEGEKMFLKRPNGSELETRIVHKIG
jgi:hypothetical protein